MGFCLQMKMMICFLNIISTSEHNNFQAKSNYCLYFTNKIAKIFISRQNAITGIFLHYDVYFDTFQSVII